jgi:hypothetical protein
MLINKIYSVLMVFALLLTLLQPSAHAQLVDSGIPIEVQASRITAEIAKIIKLNEQQISQVRSYNLDKLQKIKDLAKLREQDRRYLDLRLDMIEEEYHSRMFNGLNEDQYLVFMDYKSRQPLDMGSPVQQLAEISEESK